MSQLNNDQYVIVNLGTGSTTGGSILQNVYNASNLGGVGLFESKSGNTLYFKGLVAGDNITLIPSSTGITINSIGGSSGDFVSASTFNQYTGETSIALDEKLNESLFANYTGETQLILDNHSSLIDNNSSQINTINSLYVTGGTSGIRKLSKRRVALGGGLTGTTSFTGASATVNWGTTTNRLSQFNIGFSSQLQFFSSATLYQSMTSTGFLVNTAASKALQMDTTLGNGVSILDTPASTNTSLRMLTLNRATSGTAAKNIGTSIGFSVNGNPSGILSHRLTNVGTSTLSSAWKFSGYDNGNSASSVDIFEFAPSGSSFNTRGLVVGSTLAPQASSILELLSTDKVLTLSRILTEGNIATPVNGMIYYNSGNNKFRARENGAWKNIATGDDLDNKLGKLLDQRNIVTSAYTLTNSDCGQRLYLTGNTAVLNLPTGLNSGFQVEVVKESTTGTTVTINSNIGVTLRSVGGVNKLRDQYGVCLIVHKGGDVFTAHGNLIT
jgi:hypothetical protein